MVRLFDDDDEVAAGEPRRLDDVLVAGRALDEAAMIAALKAEGVDSGIWQSIAVPGQEIFQAAESTSGDLADPDYLELRGAATQLARTAVETPVTIVFRKQRTPVFPRSSMRRSAYSGPV